MTLREIRTPADGPPVAVREDGTERPLAGIDHIDATVGREGMGLDVEGRVGDEVRVRAVMRYDVVVHALPGQMREAAHSASWLRNQWRGGIGDIRVAADRFAELTGPYGRELAGMVHDDELTMFGIRVDLVDNRAPFGVEMVHAHYDDAGRRRPVIDSTPEGVRQLEDAHEGAARWHAQARRLEDDRARVYVAPAGGMGGWREVGYIDDPETAGLDYIGRTRAEAEADAVCTRWCPDCEVEWEGLPPCWSCGRECLPGAVVGGLVGDEAYGAAMTPAEEADLHRRLRATATAAEGRHG